MKINTSNIDNNRIVSDYEKKFGDKDTMQVTMVFDITKWSAIGLFIFALLGLFVLPFVSSATKIDTNILMGYFKDCISVLAALVMALVGYFIGRGQGK